ncbi:MAG: hypothetical protein HZB42_00555 [Sphingobacteriales bacterium]|nr:hypothetical protein [Sphingobacteriales bacterium]
MLVISRIFFFFLLVSLTGPSHAINTKPVKKIAKALIAEKNGRFKYYFIGEHVRLTYLNKNGPVRIKGIITRINNDSVEIGSFGNKKIITSIAVSSLSSLTKVQRKQRLRIGIITGVLTALIGVLLITSKGELFSSAWAFAVIGIPMIAAGYYVLISFMLTYFFEWVNKTSIKKGWKFSSGTAEKKRKLSFWFPRR